MKLQEILSAKGGAVDSISPEATLQDVVQRLLERRIGSLVVFRSDAGDQRELVGIITEHDILYACVAGSRPLPEVTVGEAMSGGAPADAHYAPVAVPEPSPQALDYYHSGNLLWIVSQAVGLAIPCLVLLSGLSARSALPSSISRASARMASSASQKRSSSAFDSLSVGSTIRVPTTGKETVGAWKP